MRILHEKADPGKGVPAGLVERVATAGPSPAVVWRSAELGERRGLWREYAKKILKNSRPEDKALPDWVRSVESPGGAGRRRPGPQPWNRVSATFGGQLDRAKAGRPSRRDRARARLLDLLADDFNELVSERLADELPDALRALTRTREVRNGQAS